ncbi:hypothetical protein ACFPM0_13755 [Pseudonocardia sulfidoxydans]|uniref:hypothetical protein n=1 Tax=Pseudonocardia sulfidoxydans TaxID=54011 RepID=UPI003613A442
MPARVRVRAQHASPSVARRRAGHGGSAPHRGARRRDDRVRVGHITGGVTELPVTW